MSKGKAWKDAAKLAKKVATAGMCCGAGRAKCGLCSMAEVVAYKVAKAKAKGA